MLCLQLHPGSRHPRRTRLANSLIADDEGDSWSSKLGRVIEPLETMNRTWLFQLRVCHGIEAAH
jgi:hypothetical protein